jgi:hypothetical protein
MHIVSGIYETMQMDVYKDRLASSASRTKNTKVENEKPHAKQVLPAKYVHASRTSLCKAEETEQSRCRTSQ